MAWDLKKVFFAMYSCFSASEPGMSEKKISGIVFRGFM